MRNITSILCTKWLGTLFVSLVTMHQAQAAIDYKLQLYNIDDDMSVQITNTLGTTYSASFPFDTFETIDITSDISSGLNTISLSLTNGPSGFTYGFAFWENGVQVVNADCGVFNTTGCNGDSYQTGNVMNAEIVFNGSSGLISLASATLTPPAINRIPISFDTTPMLTVNAAPEPSTWAMMLLGFAGLGFAAYRRTRVRTHNQ